MTVIYKGLIYLQGKLVINSHVAQQPMRMLKRQSQENWYDAIANEHLGKGVKVCMTDIWVTKSQKHYGGEGR